ncbi:threonine aldolase family protein [Aspergillus affinis]|uniref:threonine aldolase family protein n=1 Tax=Aspergillus affinis TaxID=1070780 RepID=UPI0022FF14F4|nr:l-allo-threonine aldolase [Aspergillus affinis]KAI9044321.1 l-allo-threonine aldolase [Aspergillus affinis]
MSMNPLPRSSIPEANKEEAINSFNDEQSISIACLAWSNSDEASNDFRSDYCTKPTFPMLLAIINTSLGDDVTEEDATTNSFQDYVARLLGHEAALLVLSGTMGNQVSFRTALSSLPYSILADYRGHIIHLEAGGASTLCGPLIKQVVPKNGYHLTLEDIIENSVLSETPYDCPTRVISLEIPLSGTIMPLSEVQAISRWARAQNPPIHMHLDGARLWEAVASGSYSLHEVGECFDSIQLCLTKGLGAPIGSVVVGSLTFIKRARWIRKFLGGGLRAAGVIAAPARAAIDDVFFGGKLEAAQDKARRASALWENLGGKLQRPTETNMVWLDFETSGVTRDDFYPLMRQENLKVIEHPFMNERIVFHYQISDEALTKLCRVFKAVLNAPISNTTV